MTNGSSQIRDSAQETPDIEIEPIQSELDDSESSPPVFEIAAYPADFTLDGLDQKLTSGDIKIPPFQRGFVWKLPQASRLIESFMMGLPVPQIFLYTDEEQKFLVVDGQQRLKTVSYFFEGYFGEPTGRGQRRVFRLQQLSEKSKWYNKTFQDLDDRDKRKLKNTVLRAIIIRQLDPDDDTSIYHIFERLNTGGTQLTGQEVRNCVYNGRLNDFLIELNGYGNWRRILGRPHADSRQKDIELILRYMALFHWEPQYQKPMKDFLSKFMRRNRNPVDDFLNVERQRFTGTCDLVIERLGERPFNPRTTLNAAVFDSVFTAFAKNIRTVPNDVAERYAKLKEIQEFNDCTRSATTDPDTVHTRLRLASSMLFG